MGLFDFLNEAKKATPSDKPKTIGKKKDLHLQHIEQIAAQTGDIELIKKIFNSIIGYLTKKDTSVTVTQKVDGVPLLFGKTSNDGFFVSLKNKSFDRGKVDKSQMFFSRDSIKNVGDNEDLLKNIWDAFEKKAKKDTIYFGELLFSDGEVQREGKITKNQTKVRKDTDFVLAQPNLVYYKIKGVLDSQKLGVLEIQSATGIKNIEGLQSSDLGDTPWGMSSTSDLFITDGKLDIELDVNDESIKDLKKKIEALKPIQKNKDFKITQALTSDESSKISDIKEEILNIIQTKRTILGLKGINSEEAADEGLVIKSPEFMVKLVSKEFFIFSKNFYSGGGAQSGGAPRGSTLKEFKVILPGKFQPFHSGHLSIFKDLEKKFGSGNVIIATGNSNKDDSGKELPLSFEDKKALMISSGIPESAIKNSTGLGMYSFGMGKAFTNIETDIPVYAVGAKDEDLDRLKQGGGKNEIIDISGQSDFNKAKEMLMQTLNALREAKRFYTFVTRPAAFKSGGEDVKAGNIRKTLENGGDVSKLVPYNTKDPKIQKILNKFKTENLKESTMYKWSFAIKNIMNESSFRNQKVTPIMEGGNTTFISGGKTYNVSKIDFVKTKESFPSFQKYLFSFLDNINSGFKKYYKKRSIWPQGQRHFSGSSSVVFNEIQGFIKDKNNKQSLIDDLFSKDELKKIDKQLLDDEGEIVYRWLKKYKASAGDIDIQVSEEKEFFSALRMYLDSVSISGGNEMSMDETSLLAALKQKCPSVGKICVIDNKPSIGQIISAVAMRQNSEANSLNDFLFFQCDWEPVETDDSGVPTDFAKFSRSSAVADIQTGVKGREHKYLLRVLANIAGDIDESDITVLSPKTLKPLSSRSEGSYSFSVSRGLRQKFWDPKDSGDKKSIIEYYKSSAKKPMSDAEINSVLSPSGTKVEIPSEKKIYFTDMKMISNLLGGGKDVSSFVSLSKNLGNALKGNKTKVNSVLELFEEKLLEQMTVAPSAAPGKTLNEKIKNAFEEDYNTKIKALKILRKELTGKDSVASFKTKYDEWKNKYIEKLKESGGKLSEKDMAV